MASQVQSRRRGIGALLLPAMLYLWVPATAVAQTSNFITRDVVQRTMKPYCRVSPDYRCAADDPTAKRGMPCVCVISGLRHRGRVLSESSLIRDQPAPGAGPGTPSGGAGTVATKPCSGGNDGCGGPYGPTPSGGAGTTKPIKKLGKRRVDDNIDYGGAASCGPGRTGTPPNCSTLIR
jgi:hypothetical protein